MDAIQAAALAGGGDTSMSLIGLFFRADFIVKVVITALMLASVWSWAIIVDKLLLFVAPVLAGGDGPSFAPRLRSARRLHHLQVEPVGADVLLQAYVHEP